MKGRLPGSAGKIHNLVRRFAHGAHANLEEACVATTTDSAKTTKMKFEVEAMLPEKSVELRRKS